MEKIKQFLKKLQDLGLPLIWLRDPVNKQPSVSLSIMMISFLIVILSLINIFANIVKGVDISNSMYLFIITSGLYFGRSIVRKDDKGNSMDLTIKPKS